MWVNFTDLNVMCPKDPYQQPNINSLNNGSSGYKTPSSMDPYLGYNQIKMNHVDIPKTTFMSNNWNNY